MLEEMYHRAIDVHPSGDGLPGGGSGSEGKEQGEYPRGTHAINIPSAACYSRCVDTGFILHAVDRAHAGHAEIHLIGRLTSGETFAIVERRWTPFFSLRESDAVRARPIVERERGARILASDRRTMDGEPVLLVEVPAGPVARLRDSLHQAGVRTYEADMKLSTQFLMQHGVHGAVSIDGEWRAGRRVARIYENPTLSPATISPSLSVLSLDIETDPRADTVYAVALALYDPGTGTTSGEVLLNGAGAASARCFPTEQAMLTALRARIVEMDPDIITGWNVIDFDFRVLERRCAALGVPFDIGRSDLPARFLDRSDTGGITRWRQSRIRVPGRQVLDAMWLVRMAGMGLEDYKLETVAQSVLGRGKRIDELPGESRTGAVVRLYENDPESLCVYCLEDTRLALEILLKEGLLEIALHKSLLIGTPLEQTSTSVASFEFLYTEGLHQRGIVAPSLGIDQDVVDRSPGGGIITPRAGMFRNVLAFDFKGLYPSIMRTFNIDPLARVQARASSVEDDPIVAPNGTRFSRQPGILPGILDSIFKHREEAIARGDKRAAYAYKIVQNSFYGVLGTPGCRFAASDLAGAITTFGQHILFWARDQVIARGLEVIYGDTDSLFVLSGRADDPSVAELTETGRELARSINVLLSDYARSAYGAHSRMELEFEAIYRRFFLPPMRAATDDDETESRGRAKGYAGLLITSAAGTAASAAGTAAPAAELLEVKGMEAVRHDWTPLAQELQREMLALAFHDAPPQAIGDLVRERIRELRAGRRDSSLVYRKSLRRPVEEYTRSSPPHARAAAMLPAEERTGLIRYVWTREGPQPESRRAAGYDYEHYVQKQVRPVVESLAPYVGFPTESIFAPGGQLGLF
jgi:DNA polymerase II